MQAIPHILKDHSLLIGQSQWDLWWCGWVD